MVATIERTALLRNVPLFQGCTDKELARILGSMKEVRFEAGYVICHEGETGVGLHIVTQGEVEVRVGGTVTRFLGVGSFFGEIALLDGGRRSAAVVAKTDAVTLSLPTWAFRSVLEAHPSLAVRMLEEVSRRLRTSEASPVN